MALSLSHLTRSAEFFIFLFGFNAYTEVYKGQNPSLTLARSEARHGLCDGVVGLAN